MIGSSRRKAFGFTLIELLVVFAVIALLLTFVAPRYAGSVSRAEEAVLRENLAQIRDSIDKFHADTGRYPGSLDELVTRRYLRKLPVDPIVHDANSWIIISSPDSKQEGVYDVRSSAPGRARDGTLYSQW